MELQLPPEMETKLALAAADRGCDSAALAKEAIARFLDYDEWFLARSRRAWQPPIVASSWSMRRFAR